MLVYLVRHGKTTGDVEDRYGGDYDDDLTDEGIKQAHAVSALLKGKGIQEIFSSTKKRARSFTTILAQELKVPVTEMDNLRERNNYGILTGMTRAEAKEKFPLDVAELESHPFEHRLKGSEKYYFFKERALHAFQAIENDGKDVVFLVTHGGIIRALLREFFNKELSVLHDGSFICIRAEDGVYTVVEEHGMTFA